MNVYHLHQICVYTRETSTKLSSKFKKGSTCLLSCCCLRALLPSCCLWPGCCCCCCRADQGEVSWLLLAAREQGRRSSSNIELLGESATWPTKHSVLQQCIRLLNWQLCKMEQLGWHLSKMEQLDWHLSKIEQLDWHLCNIELIDWQQARTKMFGGSSYIRSAPTFTKQLKEMLLMLLYIYTEPNCFSYFFSLQYTLAKLLQQGDPCWSIAYRENSGSSFSVHTYKSIPSIPLTSKYIYNILPAANW